MPSGPVPPGVRAIGAVPDFGAIQPGDLILFSSLRPGIIAKGIQAIQYLGGYDAAAAQWTHAAVYTGHGHLAEATLAGVRPGSIDKYLTGKHLILVRRSPDLTLEQGYQVAIRALEHHGRAYGILTAALLGLHAALFGIWRTAPWPPPRTPSICSMLYAEAFSWVTGKTIDNLEPGEITPAHLRQTQMLLDVEVTWVQIVQNTGLSTPEAANDAERTEDDQ